MTAAAAQLTLPPPRLAPTPKGQPRPGLCFIETQFPVSKMSIESYTERMANTGQALTGLGKWWGRKPLVLCRATILGLLLPATDNPVKDREVFLRLMTMDDDGMLRRKSANIPTKELFRRLPPSEHHRYFEPNSTEDDPRLKRTLSKPEKYEIQRRVFLSLPYNDRLKYCDRPEEIDGPSPESWDIINAHLGTEASSLPELVTELGKRLFGHVPRVGDTFCGGGSIPFEAARLGCEAFASDLNPVAALLTWAALNIVGGGHQIAERVHKAQKEAFDSVNRQITEWGIEHNEKGWRADLFFYCSEVVCTETGWRVPLAPNWIIAEKRRCIARLVPDRTNRRYDIEIVSNVTEAEMEAARKGTVQGGYVVHPVLQEQGKQAPAIQQIKKLGRDRNPAYRYHESGLRLWENDDIVPRPDDVFQERLYCVRWVETIIAPDGKASTERHYATPTAQDTKKEAKVLRLLRERFATWQAQGCVPSTRIEPGTETARLMRERGWTHWHHLFNPRQLLEFGLLLSCKLVDTKEARVAQLLAIGSLANMSSKLSMWNCNLGKENTSQTFSNQALNTLYNYPVRSHSFNAATWSLPFVPSQCSESTVTPEDCRAVTKACDVWITDPPYADAVSYHELSEFFLAWYRPHLKYISKEWPDDSRRALAVRGSDENFLRSMVDCYRNMAAHTPANGMHVVMFTHQDAAVWADLAMILWAAGLRVTSAWCIATETDTALKQGNYVQGTVLLVLRKQTSEETAFLDEVQLEIEAEVRRQLDTMRDLDDAKDPNFGDTDYQLAAYAAALRVLTSKSIEEIDVAHELTRTRKKGEPSRVEDLIERAVKTACDHLVPKGIDRHLWKTLTGPERLYLKGLEMESHGEHRTGVYQELARGFGVEEYKHLLAASKANEARLKTATEFGRRDLSGGGFADTVVRHALFAAFKTAETEGTRDSITWLTSEVNDYAANRQRIIETLEFLAALRQVTTMPHWHKDAEAAALLAGALRNRQDNV